MRNIYFQTVHSLKCILKDTKSLISKLLTFSIVILVLGSAFQDAFEARSLEAVRVGYLNEDEGEMGAYVLNYLLEAEAAGEWMIFVELEDFAEGQRLAGDSNVPEDERIGAMIHIAKDFSEKYNDDEKDIFTIYCGRSSQVATTVVECVFDTFANSWNATMIAVKDFDVKGLSREYSLANGVETMPLDTEESPDAMSYYAIAMLMMTLLYGAEYGCHGIAENYLGVIGDRLKTTPIKPYQQYIGKLLGMCIASTLQGLFIVVLTGVLYGANWGNNYFVLLAIIFSMACASTAIGACICMITRDGVKGQSIVSLVVIACTFFAGGFVRMDMGTLKFISPSYYAQTAVFNAVYDGNMKVVALNIGALWLFVVATSIIALLLSRRKKA